MKTIILEFFNTFLIETWDSSKSSIKPHLQFTADAIAPSFPFTAFLDFTVVKTIRTVFKVNG